MLIGYQPPSLQCQCVRRRTGRSLALEVNARTGEISPATIPPRSANGISDLPVPVRNSALHERAQPFARGLARATSPISTPVNNSSMRQRSERRPAVRPPQLIADLDRDEQILEAAAARIHLNRHQSVPHCGQ